ncbi:RNA polymerase sigma factor [Fluviicola taffensis]|uniref:RNA polymerase, sigma-24 subunit, ECF subfamily n=1 Tax=Fluviicola taffensis (strain DSM 16823 / NCIMB 13979 / RW262) TaxID=755732 RepID=F2IBP1_FLUTR|nr:sigma-70 family RNA polymerase sigma factor [Fluviicola taffensis]AEA45367.1 RNA polymerase, sigma-24 subunit, ECF subfamily [Fluviicola taffensis DSM 16823]
MAINVYFHQSSELLQEEQVWVIQAKADPARFEPLYRKYYDAILRYLKQRMEDPELAYDVASQVFIKAIKNISKYEDRGVPFGSWLYRIAKSELYQSYRELQASRTVSMENVQIPSFDTLFFENQEFEYNQSLLLAAMQRLKEEQLKLIEMRFFEQLSFKEIGESIGITENNAKVKTFRALEKLREYFLGKYAA